MMEASAQEITGPTTAQHKGSDNGGCSAVNETNGSRDVDSQFLYILPKYLELTPETERLAAMQFLSKPNSQMEDCFASLLVLLAHGHSISYERNTYDNESMRQRHAEHPDLATLSLHQFGRRAFAFDALRHIGLDVRGGIEKIHQLKKGSVWRKHAIQTNAFIVVDPEKAARYVNLGVKLDPTTLMHSNANTLGESSKNYTQILELTSPGGETPMTMKDIDEKIKTATDTEKWEWKREKFRIEARERYREVLLDMALEEKLECFKVEKEDEEGLAWAGWRIGT